MMFHSTDWFSATDSREREANFWRSFSTWLPPLSHCALQILATILDTAGLFSGSAFLGHHPQIAFCLKCLPLLQSYPIFSLSLLGVEISQCSMKNMPIASFPALLAEFLGLQLVLTGLAAPLSSRRAGAGTLPSGPLCPSP